MFIIHHHRCWPFVCITVSNLCKSTSDEINETCFIPKMSPFVTTTKHVSLNTECLICKFTRILEKVMDWIDLTQDIISWQLRTIKFHTVYVYLSVAPRKIFIIIDSKTQTMISINFQWQSTGHTTKTFNLSYPAVFSDWIFTK